MDYQEAKEIVIAYLNQDESKGYRLTVYEPGVEFELGWIFGYNLVEAIGPHIITQKVQQLFAEGKTQEEIEVLLTKAEKRSFNNEAGLVGNHPVFINRQTKQIHSVAGPLEVVIEELRDKQRGRPSMWTVYLQEDLSQQPQKTAFIRNRMDLRAVEVIKLIKQTDAGLFQGNIGEAWFLHRDLQEAGIKVELVKNE